MIIVSDLQDLLTYAGGVTARYALQGDEVSAVLVHQDKEENYTRAAETAGLKECIWLDLPKPLQVKAKQADLLASVYRRIRPDLILTYSKLDDPSHPSRSAVRDYAMTAYQTASGAGYRDGLAVSPRQTPFFGLVCGWEKPTVYLSTDAGIRRQEEALKLAGVSVENVLLKAALTASQCSAYRETPCAYAEAFTSFGSVAKTGDFIY